MFKNTKFNPRTLGVLVLVILVLVGLRYAGVSANEITVLAGAFITLATQLEKLVQIVDPKNPPPPPPAALLLLVAGGMLAATTTSCALFGGTDATIPPECQGYAVGLQACTATSRTLQQSVACENVWRQRCHRPPRVMVASDAGPPPMLPDADGGAS